MVANLGIDHGVRKGRRVQAYPCGTGPQFTSAGEPMVALIPIATVSREAESLAKPICSRGWWPSMGLRGPCRQRFYCRRQLFANNAIASSRVDMGLPPAIGRRRLGRLRGHCGQDVVAHPSSCRIFRAMCDAAHKVSAAVRAKSRGAGLCWPIRWSHGSCTIAGRPLRRLFLRGEHGNFSDGFFRGTDRCIAVCDGVELLGQGLARRAIP